MPQELPRISLITCEFTFPHCSNPWSHSFILFWHISYGDFSPFGTLNSENKTDFFEFLPLDTIHTVPGGSRKPDWFLRECESASYVSKYTQRWGFTCINMTHLNSFWSGEQQRQMGAILLRLCSDGGGGHPMHLREVEIVWNCWRIFCLKLFARLQLTPRKYDIFFLFCGSLRPQCACFCVLLRCDAPKFCPSQGSLMPRLPFSGGNANVEWKNADCSFSVVVFFLLDVDWKAPPDYCFVCLFFFFFAPCFTGSQMVGRLLCTIVTPPHHRPLSDTRPSVSHPFCGASQSSSSLPNPPLVLTRMGLNDNSPFILFWNT